jgi:hypothetical protein
MYILSSDTCGCECGEPVMMLPSPLEADETVNVSVVNKDLASVAEAIHRFTGNDVLVPASELRSNVSTKLEEVSFSYALAQLGLAAVPPEQSGA